MPQKRVRLIAGLGNPGHAYENTRHNAGFMVIDKIADSFSVFLEKKRPFSNLQMGRGFIEGIECVIVKPMTFMNKSGPPVKRVAESFRISCKDLLVVHDDIDLDFGRLKIKEKGGDGGHKGVRSIIDAFGGGDFIRLRIGVGRPGAGIDAADHVLSRFNSSEEKTFNQVITMARDAVVKILCNGAKEGMNRFNDRRIIISN